MKYGGQIPCRERVRKALLKLGKASSRQISCETDMLPGQVANYLKVMPDVKWEYRGEVRVWWIV